MILLSTIQPSTVLQSLLSGESAVDHLFRIWMVIMLAAALLCFVVGELTHNYSQTDKVWSLMPIIYSLVTLYAFPASPRIWLMTLLVTAWGLRLTYNFYRKGGYNIIPWKGEEDYRWGVLRQHPKLQKGIRITLFNLLFISLYQHILIFLFSTPLLLAAQHASASLSGLDFLAALCMFLFIVLEAIADNQLYNFQAQKRNKAVQDGKFSTSLHTGFLSQGLWNHVRHPNFVSEQAIWVSFYFFGVAASGYFLNWTMIGPFLLILLFAGSSEFTERISMEKYPDYKNYKQQVPKFIPLIFKSKRRR